MEHVLCTQFAHDHHSSAIHLSDAISFRGILFTTVLDILQEIIPGRHLQICFQFGRKRISCASEIRQDRRLQLHLLLGLLHACLHRI